MKTLCSALLAASVATGCVRAASTVPSDFEPGNPAPAGTFVEADSGRLEGEDEGDHVAFLGIPYARPPVGDYRWEPPNLPTKWAGIRKADAYGPDCIQTDDGVVEGSEDCLYLNVWTPSLKPKKLLPVMVFIHGGSYVAGSGTSFDNMDLYMGDELAPKGGVVLVTFNYRLGALGFLAHPGMTSFNHGTLDQIAALQWVQRNIKNFGGSADNVTLFGESAGGHSVCTIMGSPLAKNLFHKTIIESAGCVAYDLAEEAQNARQDAKKLGCARDKPADEFTCLRQLPAPAIIAAQRHSDMQVKLGRLAFAPVIDQQVLTRQPLDTFKLGAHQHMPVIVGSNVAEVPGMIHKDNDNQAAYESIVRQFFPDEPPFTAVTSHYSKARFESYKDALAAFHTDLVFTCSVRRTAMALAAGQQEPVYVYAFDALGGFHGSELPFVFQRLGMFGGDLQRHMLHYWTGFAKSGVPAGPESPAWLPYNTTGQRMLLAWQSVSMTEDHAGACNLFP